MIVWLASYPRSGNTLLRTVLKQTMGLASYSDELVRPVVGLTESVKTEFGHMELGSSWESFYENVSASEEIYLVKTHLPPRDNQPAMYVVRDGRRALISYHQYHRRFFPEHSKGLINLVLGDDYYGDWSEHFGKWMSDERKTLLLRYEDLIDVSPEILRSIADFVGHIGPMTEWVNPFFRLQKENPDFFRAGEAEWRGAPGWHQLINGAFFLLHGDLMNVLGYADPETIRRAQEFVPYLGEFANAARSLLREKKRFEEVCQERLAVINTLDKEVSRLSDICRERISVINLLDAEVKRLSSRNAESSIANYQQKRVV